jgi:hypothetical protein
MPVFKPVGIRCQAFTLKLSSGVDVPLCAQLSSLQTENSSLRWQSPGGAQQPPEPPGRPPARGGRPMSMYETGSGSRPYPSHRGEALRHGGLVLQPLPPNVSTTTPRDVTTPTTTKPYRRSERFGPPVRAEATLCVGSPPEGCLF